MKYLSILLFLSICLISCEEKDDLEKANQYYNSADYKKAIQAYNRHLEMKPAHEIAIYNRGRAYEELGQYDKAVDDFLRVIEINPRNIGAYLSYGKQFYRKKTMKMLHFNLKRHIS